MSTDNAMSYLLDATQIVDIVLLKAGTDFPCFSWQTSFFLLYIFYPIHPNLFFLSRSYVLVGKINREIFADKHDLKSPEVLITLAYLFLRLSKLLI